MPRLDHIAHRVADRNATVKFLQEAFQYHVQAEFEIFFNEEKTDKALCVALEPPEKIRKYPPFQSYHGQIEYHLAPEIFVSEGTPGSIVWDWVQARGGIGGIHHLAYEVPDVAKHMQLWLEKGWGKFTSDKPFKCDGLTQVFTEVHPLSGIVYEFIERQGQGFCADNVKQLMESSAKLDGNMK